MEVCAFGKTLHAAAYQIGVYPDEIAALAKDGESGRDVEIVKATLHQRKLVMSVDRLDYSKGLVERFRAFERLIEHDAHQRNNVSFLQIAPPTRSDVDAYRDIRLQLEAESGRINGRYAELDWTPIRYPSAIRGAGARRAVPRGACRAGHAVARWHESGGEGVCVRAGSGRSRRARVSQFVGAAHELTAALIVNPLDIDGIADALATALRMPLNERKARYDEMMPQLRENNVSVWRDNFLRDLKAR